MKSRFCPVQFHRISLIRLVITAGALHAITPAFAASGTWNVDADGLWGTNTNWLSNIIADDLASTANFTNNITTDRTVHLDGDRTLNKLVFRDNDTASEGGWVLGNNGVTTNNIILSGSSGAATGTAPAIEVSSLAATKTATIYAIIEGSFGLTKNGTGTLVLSGANTYSGTTTIGSDTGSVRITQAAGFGTSTVSVRPGTASGVAQLNFAVPASGVGSSSSDPNIISNAFNLGGQGTTVASGGFGAIQNISGFNKITGNITRSNTGGTSYNIVSNANILELSGTLGSSVTTTRTFNFGGAGDIVVTGAINNGVTSSTTSVAKDGTGTLTLTGSKAFTGGLVVRAGQLIARSSGGALGGAGSGAVTLGNTTGSDAATLALATSSTFNNPITVATGSSGSVTINNFANYSPTLAGTMTLNKDLTVRNTNASGSNNLTISGTVSGSGGLLISSTNANNTVTFSGTGNHSGATVVDGGIFALTGSLTTSSVEIKQNATLTGNGSIGGNLTLRSGAHLAVAVADTATNQSARVISGALTLDSGNIIDLTAAAQPAIGLYVLATATGGITGTPTVINKTGLSGQVTVDTASSPNRLLLTISSGFSSWISGSFANGNTVPSGKQGANDDPDGDGLSNLEEYAVAGLDPTVTNGAVGTFVGKTLSISKRQPIAPDITYAIEKSTDLGVSDAWQEVPAGETYVNTDSTIAYTLPGSAPREFLRLKVQKP